jgi:CRP/FNR family transcriptional regulator, anaerobic regulatory protein
MESDWTENVPLLNALDEPAKTLLRESALRKQIPRGVVLFPPGDQCIRFLLIASGTVRVQRIAESGREIELYRVSTY